MWALVGHLAENAKQVVGRPLHIDKVESKNEIWRRITRPGLFGKLEISNSPNRYPGIDIIISI